MPLSEFVFQQCVAPACQATYGADEALVACKKCGELLDVCYDWDKCTIPSSLAHFESYWQHRYEPLRFSGVWRFHDLLPFATPESVVTIGEGQTLLQRSASASKYVGLTGGQLFLQYEGMNPSGSFKDNGMAAAFTHARALGSKRAACASTGNTSASLAMYCSATQLMKAVIFVGSGKISIGKLAQALDYGALTVQLAGDFDDAMRRVKEVCQRMQIYLVNSVNPFRLEGQKTVMYRVLEALRWEVPDWIVVPGGNLGNSSSFGKAFIELKKLGLIDRPPRIAVINAEGASTLSELVNHHGVSWNQGYFPASTIDEYNRELDDSGRRASTIASAIEINRPVNLSKCLRAIDFCDGVVLDVNDQDILDAKAQVGRGGLGCEPASAASVAGVRKLVEKGTIGRDERVVCILTGHVLKDSTATVAYHTTDQDYFNEILGKRGVRVASFANRAISVSNDLEEIIRAIQLYE